MYYLPVPTYRVKTSVTLIRTYEVEADSKEEAAKLFEDGEGDEVHSEEQYEEPENGYAYVFTEE